MGWWLATTGVVVAAAAVTPDAPTRLSAPALVPGGGAIAFEAEGRVRYLSSVLTGPDRLVVDFLNAGYRGGPVRWRPPAGTPIRAVRVAHRARGVVRAVFELTGPTAPTPRVEHVAGNRYRFVLAWAAPKPAPARAEAAASGPVVFDVTLGDGQVHVMTSSPVLGRIRSLAPAAGYRVDFDGAQLDPAARRVFERSQGDIRQVRVASDAAGVRLFIETARSGRLFKLAVGPTSWAFTPLLDGPVAVPAVTPPTVTPPTVTPSVGDPGPAVIGVSGRPARPGRLPARPPGFHKRPAEAWVVESPELARGLMERLRAVPSAVEGLRFRQPALDAAWRWRSTSQMIYSSNIGLITPEAAGWGALHRYHGTFHQGVPALRGYMMGYTEHQRLRFAEPRYDFDSMLHAMALTHHLGGLVHAYEGGALMYRRGAYSLANDSIDTDLFAGVGLFGSLSPLSHWSATLTADRVMAASLSGSYYGQALRTRYMGPLPLGTWLQADGMVQRLDPVIIGAPSYRWYGDVAVEKAVGPRVRLALQARLGGQLGVTPAWYVQGGPSLSLWF